MNTFHHYSSSDCDGQNIHIDKMYAALRVLVYEMRVLAAALWLPSCAQWQMAAKSGWVDRSSGRERRSSADWRVARYMAIFTFLILCPADGG